MAYRLTHTDFYAALKEGRLLGLKCRACGGYTVPPRATCQHCGEAELEAAELSGRGEIKSYTVIHVPPEGFEGPYVVALAELEEGPWLMGNVEGLDLRQPVPDLVGRQVRVGHRVVPPARYTAGEGVAITFSLV
jgi:uncharacterized OB-fold protein